MRPEIISVGDLVYSGLARGLYIPIHIFQKAINLKHYKRNSYLSVVTNRLEAGPVNILMSMMPDGYAYRIIIKDSSIIFYPYEYNHTNDFISKIKFKTSTPASGLSRNNPSEYKFSELPIYDSNLEIINDKQHHPTEKLIHITKNLEHLREFIIKYSKESSIFLPLINKNYFLERKNNILSEPTEHHPEGLSYMGKSPIKPAKFNQNEVKHFPMIEYRKPHSLEKAFNKRVIEVSQHIRRGYILDAIRLLRGFGPGFTPAGDDFIMGLILAINLKRKLPSSETSTYIKIIPEEKAEELKTKILNTAYYGNDFIDFHLRLISSWRLPLKIKLIIEWVVNGSKTNMVKSIYNLVKTGHSSGIDLICGFITGMECDINYQNLLK